MPTGWDQFDVAMPGKWMDGNGFTAITNLAEVFEDRNESPVTNVHYCGVLMVAKSLKGLKKHLRSTICH